MSRPTILFCYRYGLLGGVSAQLLNRFPYLSRAYDVRIVYEQDYGMVRRFPAGVATVAPTPEIREKAIVDLGPDITVVIDSPSFIDAWRAVSEPGRLVLEVHTTTPNLAYLRRLEELDGISHIVTVSSYMEQMLTRLGLRSLAPITIVPDCLDDRWREQGTFDPLEVKPVIWVGKLDGHKRWRTAADLIDILSQTREILPIFIGGLTSPESEVQALATRLATSPGLSRGVWWPRVEYGKMPAVYSTVAVSGGVHLCTTVNESFGMAVAESVLRGCAVVAPAVGALPELLPPVAMYEPGDWTGAVAKVAQVLDDATFRTQLLSSADHVRDLTSPQRVAEAYGTVVESVLQVA